MEKEMQEIKNFQDTSIPVGGEVDLLKKSFFHQFIGFQISKNPHILQFAKQNLITTHPRSVHNVEFGEAGEWFITYEEGEQPVRYEVYLTHDMNISDVSWSSKYNCYFDYMKMAPFVVDADIIALIYLSSLFDMRSEVVGEWMHSVTKGRYSGFNPVHI